MYDREPKVAPFHSPTFNHPNELNWCVEFLGGENMWFRGRINNSFISHHFLAWKILSGSCNAEQSCQALDPHTPAPNLYFANFLPDQTQGHLLCETFPDLPIRRNGKFLCSQRKHSPVSCVTRIIIGVARAAHPAQTSAQWAARLEGPCILRFQAKRGRVTYLPRPLAYHTALYSLQG